MSAKRKSKVLFRKAVPYQLYKGLTFTTIRIETEGFKRKCRRALTFVRAFLFSKENWKKIMRNICDCVKSFLPLLETEYEIVLGRKRVSVTLRITFDKKDCFHLMGLQYLKDRPELNRDRGKVFDEIVSGKIKREQIEKSDFYSKIEERVHFIPLIEGIIDSNDTIFKYNQKANMYSMIDADYIMKSQLENRSLFLFLSQGDNERYFCRSFFPQGKKDYTKNQASWTLLFKKKKNLKTGAEIILYDRLKKAELTDGK